MIKQRILGVVMMLLTFIIPIITDGDATVCIITLPIAIILLAAKDVIIY